MSGSTLSPTRRHTSPACLSFVALQVINVDAQLLKTRSGLPAGAVGGFSIQA